MITFEDVMNITPGSSISGNYVIDSNATFRGSSEYIRDIHGNIVEGNHYVETENNITVLDISYSRQLALIQYPLDGGGHRQGYIRNDTSKIQYFKPYNWHNNASVQQVYSSYEGSNTFPQSVPQDIPANGTATFLFRIGNRYNIAYDTNKGILTGAGFVDYSGGIIDNPAFSSNGQKVGDSDPTQGIPAGGIVLGGRSYPVNAIAQVGQEVTDIDNNSTGHYVNANDEITVIDISYSKQKALVQFLAGNSIRQGYIVNDPRFIAYNSPYQWVNDNTNRVVYSDYECTKPFGSVGPFEAATVLYTKADRVMIVYDAPNGVPNDNITGTDMLNKNGFVKFAGNQPVWTPGADQLLDKNYNNAIKTLYGTSPNGHPLNTYTIGNGSNILFANFAIHGFEDDWGHDGTALVTIANQLIDKFSKTGDLHGWTIIINPCANPDGTFDGITNDGPGRCTVESRIDMNRCFPFYQNGVREAFHPHLNSRNYVGYTSLGAPEAVALANLLEGIHDKYKINDENKLVVIDFHGWMGLTQGNQNIGKYFNNQFNGTSNSKFVPGFFSSWAESYLNNTQAVLVEYPKNTRSIDQCNEEDYSGRTYNAIMNLLKDNPGHGPYRNQWVNENGHTFYYGPDGKMITGWYKIEGYMRYFDTSGELVIGWRKVEGLMRYFDASGVLVIGWYTVDGYKRYFDASGVLVTGWRKIENYMRYFDSSGVLETGIQVIDGKTYIFDKNGAMYTNITIFGYTINSEGVAVKANGWIKSDNKMYYYENGKMITGWKTIDKFLRYFNKDGTLAHGFTEVEGLMRYFDASGVLVTGWYTVDGYKRYFDASGVLVTGWRKIENYMRYFDSSGVLETGIQVIDGKTYIFDKNGAMYTNITIFGYTINSEGVAVKANGWIKSDNKMYYYENGKMITGWKTIDKLLRYFNKDGTLAHGFTEVEGLMRYFDASGVLVIGWYTVDGYKRYFDASGVLVTGWRKIENYMRYFDSSGVLETGIQVIDGKTYIFDKNGAMYTNITIFGYTINSEGVAVKANGWIKSDNKMYYYENGKMITGWKTIDKLLRYFNKDGTLAHGFTEVEGLMRYFDASGVLVTGWYTVDGYKRYFDSSGVLIKGLKKIGEYIYYFDGNGAMFRNGTNHATGLLCHYNNAGHLFNSWYYDGAKYWFYYGSDGLAYKNKKEVINGKIYNFDKNGACWQIPGQGQGQVDLSGTYADIIKEFGFTSNNILSDGDYSKAITVEKGQFELGLTANIVGTNTENLNNFVRILDGQPVAFNKSIEALEIPFGKDVLCNILQKLDNGLIGIEITDTQIRLSFTKMNGYSQIDSTLNVDLYLIQKGISTVPNSWKGLIQLYKKRIVPNYTTVDKISILGTTICATILAIGMVGSFGMEGIVIGIAAGSEDALEDTTEKGITDMTEETFGQNEEQEVNELIEAKAINKKETTKFASEFPKLLEEKKLLGPEGTAIPSKYSRAMDKTDPSKYGNGFSDIEKRNPTIDNINATKSDDFKSNNKAAFIAQSKKTLTLEYLEEEMNSEGFKEMNKDVHITEDFKAGIRIEYKKFITLVEDSIKDAEDNGGESRNGDPSRHPWNVENCAEIWAVKNAILVGAKLENLVVRTLQVPAKKLLGSIPAEDWKYVEPCDNCKATFREFLINFSE